MSASYTREATLAALGDGFQRTTGKTLSIDIDRGSAVKTRIRAGEPADVIVVMRSESDELPRDGRIDPKTSSMSPDHSLASSFERARRCPI
jgi:hypothetical protein